MQVSRLLWPKSEWFTTLPWITELTGLGDRLSNRPIFANNCSAQTHVLVIPKKYIVGVSHVEDGAFSLFTFILSVFCVRPQSLFKLWLTAFLFCFEHSLSPPVFTPQITMYVVSQSARLMSGFFCINQLTPLFFCKSQGHAGDRYFYWLHSTVFGFADPRLKNVFPNPWTCFHGWNGMPRV